MFLVRRRGERKGIGNVIGDACKSVHSSWALLKACPLDKTVAAIHEDVDSMFGDGIVACWPHADGGLQHARRRRVLGKGHAMEGMGE